MCIRDRYYPVDSGGTCTGQKGYTTYATGGSHDHDSPLSVTSSDNSTQLHSHTVTIDSTGEADVSGRNIPPYYSVIFIIKVR